MAMADNTVFSFHYPVETIYQAFINALSKTTKFRIVSTNANIILIKSGVSLTSWGEDITITIAQGQNGNSDVIIASSLKMGLFDWGKNKKNLNTIIGLVTQELDSYGSPNQPEPPQTT